jgi:hypothetical protein
LWQAVDTVATRSIRYEALLTMLWLLAGAALLVATAALLKGRRAARRLERLSESYWELRYEHGQLSARVARLEGSPDAAAGQSEPGEGKVAFVPLSSLRR